MQFKAEKGQAMVEFALVLPILILLLCAIIDFGWIFGSQLLVNNACREAARYTAIHYNDSNEDNDESIASGIVMERAPTLEYALTSLTVSSSGKVTVKVISQISVLTPFISMLYPDGVCKISAECVMRLE